MDPFAICQSAQPIGRQRFHSRRTETGLEHWFGKMLSSLWLTRQIIAITITITIIIIIMAMMASSDVKEAEAEAEPLCAC